MKNKKNTKNKEYVRPKSKLEKKLEEIRQKNENIIKIPVLNNFKKIKCELCRIYKQQGVMSIENENTCQDCIDKLKDPNYYKTPQQKQREYFKYKAIKEVDFQKQTNKELNKKINDLDTKGISASKKQLEIAKYLQSNSYKVQIEYPIIIGNFEYKKFEYGLKDKKIYVDMLVDDKLVIEFYGTYYHMDDRIYEENYNFRNSITASQKWSKDKDREEIIKSMGYKLIIVKELDYDQDKKSVLEFLKNECEKIKKEKNNLISSLEANK